MNKVFHVTRASIFLILASFASTALSVTVGSESGGASLDGAWSFGCSASDTAGGFDEMEYLVFQGNTVESRSVQYTSTNGGCGGGVVDTESELFDFNVSKDFESEGWLGENDQPASPPECQDPGACLDGKLDPKPNVTEVVYIISAVESEFDVLYIDDTGLSWYLWRDAGEDDMVSEYMSIFEPLIKTDLVLSPIPVPAAFWLFGTALIGFIGMSRRRKVA